jgi:hypothetical protein
MKTVKNITKDTITSPTFLAWRWNISRTPATGLRNPVWSERGGMRSRQFGGRVGAVKLGPALARPFRRHAAGAGSGSALDRAPPAVSPAWGRVPAALPAQAPASLAGGRKSAG